MKRKETQKAEHLKERSVDALDHLGGGEGAAQCRKEGFYEQD